MIEKIKIENFKGVDEPFVLDFNEGINILVGDNETGKSTILEAIHLTLTGMFRGRPVRGNLTQYLFNYEIIQKYLKSVNDGVPIKSPEILIELYVSNEHAILEGDKCSMSSTISKASGIAIRIGLDEKYQEEYEALLIETTEDNPLVSLPIEYYDVEWYSFARKPLTARSIPLKSSLIDVGFSKFQNGSDMYISRIVQNTLEIEEKTKVAQAYRKVKDSFSQDTAITEINSKITDLSKLSDKKIELSVDLGSRSTWEGSLVTQLDNIPFDFIGKGEQSIIKTDLALSSKQSEKSTVILLEEPECHISHARLNQLLASIKENYTEKQIIMSTHSSFVANKLGLDNLIMLNKNETIRFNSLSNSTKEFFEKVSGYDTLRLLLCNKAILVEGDSDELILQRAYKDKYEKLPIENGVDIISVGTSFLRFLEIAEKLEIKVAVVTDNDGNLDAVSNKYAEYLGNNKKDNIDIFYDGTIHTGDLKIGNDPDKAKPFNYNTLEPLLLKENSLEVFNKIFKKDYSDENSMHKYMKKYKTDCALAIFTYKEKIKYPSYIVEAIS